MNNISYGHLGCNSSLVNEHGDIEPLWFDRRITRVREHIGDCCFDGRDPIDEARGVLLWAAFVEGLGRLNVLKLIVQELSDAAEAAGFPEVAASILKIDVEGYVRDDDIEKHVLDMMHVPLDQRPLYRVIPSWVPTDLHLGPKRTREMVYRGCAQVVQAYLAGADALKKALHNISDLASDEVCITGAALRYDLLRDAFHETLMGLAAMVLNKGVR